MVQVSEEATPKIRERVKNKVEVTHHSHGRRKDYSAASHSPNSMYNVVLETFHSWVNIHVTMLLHLIQLPYGKVKAVETVGRQHAFETAKDGYI